MTCDRHELAGEVVELLDRTSQGQEGALVVWTARARVVLQAPLVPVGTDQLDHQVQQPALVSEPRVSLLHRGRIDRHAVDQLSALSPTSGAFPGHGQGGNSCL